MIEPMYVNFAVMVLDEKCSQCQNCKIVESENGTLHCKNLGICFNALELREGDSECGE